MRPLVVAVLCTMAAACSVDGGAPDASPTSGTGGASLEWAPVLDELGLPDPATVERRVVFATGFEDPGELDGFYVTPQSDLTHHERSGERTYRGAWAHKAWVTGPGGPGLERDGPNHRGYPTIQLQRTPGGPAPSPTLTELWVWLDADLGPGQWFSLATFTNDATDAWGRVVTVNVGSEGWLHLFHVPSQGVGEPVFQRTDLPFPLRTWVRVTVELDLRAPGGAVAVWQDGTLLAAARVDAAGEVHGGELAQAHFGLYTAPEVADALVYNDELRIETLG